jgi:uncharacterized protein
MIKNNAVFGQDNAGWRKEMSGPEAESEGTLSGGRATRLALAALGWAAVGLATLGVFLPVLPTTPFLLVAVWAFAKSSPRMRVWLYEHPRFGGFLRDWRDEGAIPLRGKIAAVAGMTAAWHIVFFTTDKPWVPIAVGGCLAAVALYVVTRPGPSRGK